MLLHRSDLNISANFVKHFGVFNIRNAKQFANFSDFVAFFADLNEICLDFEFFSDFVENAETRCNFSKFLDFNSIFIMLLPDFFLNFVRGLAGSDVLVSIYLS